MNAIILAAGEGKRLKPLTNDKPKCMIELVGKPILQRQLDLLRDCGINDISIVTGYADNKVIFDNVKYFKNLKFDTTNMVETLFCAEEEIKGSTIVSYGDIIYEKNVLKKLIAAEDDINVVIDKNWYRYWKIRFDNPLEDLESLVIDDGYIVNIGQKVKDIQEIMGQYIGLMKFQGKGATCIRNFYLTAKNEFAKGKNILNPKLPLKSRI